MNPIPGTPSEYQLYHYVYDEILKTKEKYLMTIKPLTEEVEMSLIKVKENNDFNVPQGDMNENHG